MSLSRVEWPCTALYKIFCVLALQWALRPIFVSVVNYWEPWCYQQLACHYHWTEDRLHLSLHCSLCLLCHFFLEFLGSVSRCPKKAPLCTPPEYLGSQTD